MNVRAVYKTKADFEADIANGKFYEGFVIGVGYAYVEYACQMPGNLNGFGHFTDDYPEHNRYQGFRIQKIEASAEMIALSLRAHVSGVFSEYVVMRGDTLWDISRDLGVTVDDLVRWNNISDPNKIIAGKTLMVDINKAKANYSNPFSIKTQNRLTNSSNDDVANENNYKDNWAFKSLDITGNTSAISSMITSAAFYSPSAWYGRQLQAAGRFSYIYNGMERTADLHFSMNQHVSRSAVAAGKASTLARFNFFSKMGNIGRGLGYFGIGNSVAQFGFAAYSGDTMGMVEYGADATMGRISMMGPLGAFIGGYYYLHKWTMPYSIEYCLKLHIEMAEKGNGVIYFHQIAPFK